MNQKKIKNSNLKNQSLSDQTGQPNHPKRNDRRSKKQFSSRSKAVKEYSSGGIVFRLINGEIEIVLLQDLKSRWSIPKGHIESGETPEKTALREVAEETNLTDLKIISKLDKIHFFYRMNGKLIFMMNFIYLIESTNFNDILQTEEDAPWITDVKWFKAEEAYDILEYKATKVILREAINKIKKLYDL
ncbi:MAG: NUDIX domain-containing protein [Candidatus Saccharibacteria bacterium]